MRTAMTPIAESPAGTPRQSVAEIASIGKVDRVGDFCLVVITLVLIGWGMHTLKSLLIPLTLAALLTIVAGPAVDAITQKRRIGKRLRTFFCRCHLVAVRRLQAKLLERGYRVGDDVDDGVEEDTSVATPGASPRSDGVEDDSSYSADSESELMRAAAADSARGISWDSQPSAVTGSSAAVGAMQQRGVSGSRSMRPLGRRTARSISLSVDTRKWKPVHGVRPVFPLPPPTNSIRKRREQCTAALVTCRNAVLESVVIGRCPFPLALAIVLLAVVFVFGAMGSVIGLAIQQLLSTDSTKYIHGIDELFDSVAHLASGLRVNVTGTELYDYAIDSINVEKVLLGEVGAFVNVLGQIGLTMMFLVFLLPARHGDALEHIVGVALPNDPSLVDRVTASLAEMQQQIALYFRVKLLVAFISGAATGVLALCFGFVRCGVVTLVLTIM